MEGLGNFDDPDKAFEARRLTEIMPIDRRLHCSFFRAKSTAAAGIVVIISPHFSKEEEEEVSGGAAKRGN